MILEKQRLDSTRSGKANKVRMLQETHESLAFPYLKLYGTRLAVPQAQRSASVFSTASTTAITGSAEGPVLRRGFISIDSFVETMRVESRRQLDVGRLRQRVQV